MRLRHLFLILIFIIGCQQEAQIDETGVMDIKESVNMKLTSSAFEDNGNMPSQFTCDGDNISPPLEISEVPEGAKSLALIADDPDAPSGTWVHWVVWNIPAGTKEIAEGTEPEGVQGKTDFGRTGYGGPCPPSGTHRYFFRLYALDTKFELAEGSVKKDLEEAMEDHVMEKAQLMGNYKKQ